MKVYTLSPYTTKFIVIVSSNPEEAINKLPKKYKGLELEWGEDYAQTAAGTFERIWEDKRKKTTNQYIVVVFNKTKGIDPETIAHEAVHVSNYCFMYHGVTLDRDNDEPAAYLVGHIVGIITKEISTNG